MIGATVLRYMVAVWTVGLAFAATLVMSPLMQPGVSPLFLLAVMISAWRGGLGAGLLATVLSASASAFVLLPPAYSLRVDRNDLLQLVVFTFAAVVIGSLSATRKSAEEEREALLVREQAARKEAEQANAVKDEFIAAASHELRTPLTTIKALTRVLLRQQPSETERREYLEDIASECDRQIDLVHNLLDLSRVEDTGRGIRAEDLPRIFDKFYRGRAATDGNHTSSADEQEVPGIGLGLHLARALVEGMNGTIEVRSQAGQGSTFAVRLPVWEKAANANDKDAASTPAHALSLAAG